MYSHKITQILFETRGHNYAPKNLIFDTNRSISFQAAEAEAIFKALVKMGNMVVRIDQILHPHVIHPELRGLWTGGMNLVQGSLQEAFRIANFIASQTISPVGAATPIDLDAFSQPLKNKMAVDSKTLSEPSGRARLEAIFLQAINLAVGSLQQALNIAELVAQQMASPTMVPPVVICTSGREGFSHRDLVSFFRYAVPQDVDPFLQQSIVALSGLDVQTLNALVKAGIRTLYLFSFLNTADISVIHGIGRNTAQRMSEIKKASERPDLLSQGEEMELDFLTALSERTREVLRSRHIFRVGQIVGPMEDHRRFFRNQPDIIRNIEEAVYPLGFMSDSMLEDRLKVQQATRR